MSEKVSDWYEADGNTVEYSANMPILLKHDFYGGTWKYTGLPCQLKSTEGGGDGNEM